MTISIVTPFSGQTYDLLPDYERATLGARLVLIDNASDAETAEALGTLPPERGIVIRNESNLGFAAGNNQGYARADGDIIVFLNSDIAGDPSWLAMVADDVKDGALYGPSLNQQLVAGRWLPYIEGWCIAATRATWERLVARTRHNERLWGPWDDEDYPGPYWEDNDLCLRAVQAGIALIQTAWPIQHKGGRTAGPILNHAASFAANERTFTERVLQTKTSALDTPTHAAYARHVYTQSDIQHHLPLLYSLARGNVVELGTRGGVSTAALLAGVEAHGGHVYSVDIDDCSQVAAGHPLWTFTQGDSRNPETPFKLAMSRVKEGVAVEGIDILLIDTEHRYEVTQAELEMWAPYVKAGGHVCLHDTETFPGVLRAVREFCAARGWQYTNVRPCHGMAVIDVPVTKDMRAGETVSTEGAAWAMEAQP